MKTGNIWTVLSVEFLPLDFRLMEHHDGHDDPSTDIFPHSSVQMQRPKSSESSCVSMKSDRSMDPPLKFSVHTDPGFKSDRPEPSCVSMKSDWSMDHPLKFSRHSDPGIRPDPPESSCLSMKSDRSMDPPLKFSRHTDPGFRLDPPEPSCVSMKSDLSMDPPPKLGGHTDHGFRLDPLEPSCVSMKSDQSINPQRTLSGHTELGFSSDHPHPEALKTFRSNLRKKFQCLYEGTAKQGNPTLLNEIYTDLYITESDCGDINNEHEVRQIETQSRRAATEDKPIKCTDIFRPLPGQDKPIRTVLTKGVAGIGKTVSVQKFILDWAEGTENQEIQLIFPLPFRELNLLKDKNLSLSDLLQVFFIETKEIKPFTGEYKVVFVFDGLDECRLTLDFNVKLCNISESAPVDVLLTNLIAGNLLPSALIWITSRPAAADLVPSECLHRVTEVRGFNDPQKEEYFRKRISDQSQADKIIRHLKSSRSLFIMCHIPVFCWISSTVLEKMLSGAESGEIPKTLTQMYTHFLIIQTKIKQEKDYEKKVKDEDMILKLGKLAFQQLVKGNLIFYEEDLSECGIDETEASIYSGLCTQIFREELGFYQGKVFCFVHLSIQEHLGALYVLLSFLLYKRDVLNENLSSKHAHEFTCHTISDLHQRAVDKALQSTNGHLDLFLRFLLGLSLESNQKLLKGLLTHVRKLQYSKEKTIEYIKTRIRMNPSPEKSINLFHSLNELGDISLVNEIQECLGSGGLSSTRLSSSQWSAVVFVLLTSECLNEFHLSKYRSRKKGQNHMSADELLQKLLPVVEASRSAQLSDCGVTAEGCAALASALRSDSDLRELDLSGNKIGDKGVKLLSDGLKDPHCKLEKLTLRCSGVTDEGCAALASALRSNSHLRELDLTGNKQQDSGVILLSNGLKDHHCKLKKLWLWDCEITDEGCAALASALRSNSHLRELDLSWNKIENGGLTLLSVGLKDPLCKLEKLTLINCEIKAEGCAALTSALRSNSYLRELELSENIIGDKGLKLLSDGLKDPHCKLEKLMLRCCEITAEGCAALTSALRSNSHLRELDLTGNKLQDSGVYLLSSGLKDPHCSLEKLMLSDCNLTREGCAALASALRSDSHLRELDLTENRLRHASVKSLSALKDNPHYKLETLLY
ncbi:NACHT, LRR and PYD domains-containing protein 12-like isoform X4 [Pimephales promelas]|uniref:NACHT, LRR and PYD domains-containing protein 12-like isoform X4 n=1 Tax=Pimephales promelas TaxID=90988 RepID=UPI0019556EE5|nr:NACHT, LRR and PYD domains-containing protein 12-like isoform X4 [Pimephales promelas]